MAVKTFIIAFLIMKVNSISTSSVTTTEGITTQNSCSPDDTKCLTKFQYNILMDSFIKLIAVKIQKNHTDDAFKILQAVPPVDDVRILKIVEQTMTRNDFELIYLLQFINQTTSSPNESLNYFINIFHGMNKNGTRSLLDWLDLEYFLANSFGEHKNFEIYQTLLSDIRTSAKNILMSHYFYSVASWFSSYYCSKDKHYQPRHLSFIVESYFHKDYEQVENVTRFLSRIDWSVYKFLGFIELYNQMESSGHLSKTFKLIPALKLLAQVVSFERDLNTDKKLRIEEFFQKLPKKSVMKTILSNEYFRLRNEYNKEYLYIKHRKPVSLRTTLKPKQKNFARTVPNSDIFSEEVNWKFSIHQRFGNSMPYELKLKNEFSGSQYSLLPVECSVDASVLHMQHENDYQNYVWNLNDDQSMFYAWYFETDDFFSDRFRIRNAYTDEYLGVRVATDDNQLEPNVILVPELNTEYFESVHWTLEPPVEKLISNEN